MVEKLNIKIFYTNYYYKMKNYFLLWLLALWMSVPYFVGAASTPNGWVFTNPVKEQDWVKNAAWSTTEEKCKTVLDRTSCDYTWPSKVLRLGYEYEFADEFWAWKISRRLFSLCYNFDEKWDYNQIKQPDWSIEIWNNPKFWWTPEFLANGKWVEKWTSTIITKADKIYKINAVPDKRSPNNLFIKYLVEFSNNEDGKVRYQHTECYPHEISRCGDGVVDTDWEKKDPNDPAEECDPAAPEWQNRKDSKTCSASCTIEYEKPVCGSTYNMKTEYTSTSDQWLNSKTEGLCDKWEVKRFNFNGNKYTWWCVNGDSVPLMCEAYQEYCGDGKKNGKEECDPKDPNKVWWWDGCSATCDKTIYKPGKCGSVYNGNKTYLDITKDWITKDTVGLCENGNVADFVKNTSSHTYTWKCDSYWSKDSCWADQERCGDGIKNGNEECDWTEGCNSQCKLTNNKPTWCNETFTRSLRLWETRTFIDTWDAGWHDRYLYYEEVNFVENHGDYDNNPNLPTFTWTPQLINNWMKIDANTSLPILKSTPYHLVTPPTVRASNNLYIEYIVWYDDVKHTTTPSKSDLYPHKECFNYEISRCGDGVLDTEYGEECDPGSESTKVWPDWQVCNSECKFGSKWHLVIEKTLKWSSWVVNAWDTITWSLKITASWWDVKDFIVTDKLPEVLAFDSYSIPNPVWLTVSNPITSWNEVKWNVKWTLEEWKYLEIIVNTKAKWMPEKDYVNVACVAPADNPTEEDCDDKPLPSVWVLDIKKTLISKDKYVTHLWQELEWKIVVRAINGYTWINRIEDKLPEELNYKSSEVVHTPKGINVWEAKPSDDKRNVMWPAKWILLSWEYIEIHLTSEVVKMPNANKQVVNVACVKPMTWEELCDTWHVSNVWIQKFVLDANGKEQKAITWSVWDTITYKVHFGNNGDEPVIVGLKDFLPKWVKFVSWELVVSNNGRGWSLSTWSFDMKYEWNQIKIDWVEINKYEKVHLNPNESWVLTIVGTILEPGDKSENRTNFACIYDENDNVIDCDDAHHNVGVLCEKLDIVTTSFWANWWNTDVKCSTLSGKIAKNIEIDCGNGTIITWSNISSLTGNCAYPWGDNTYNLQCKVEGLSTDACKGKVDVKESNPGGENPYCQAAKYEGDNKFTCKSTDRVYAIGIDCEHETNNPQLDDWEESETGERSIMSVTKKCDTSKPVQCYVKNNRNSDWDTLPTQCWWEPSPDPDPTPRTKDCTDMTSEERADNPICNFARLECFNVNAWNVSIEKTEYLPFYLNIERDQSEWSGDYIYAYYNVDEYPLWNINNLEQMKKDDECLSKTVALNSMLCHYRVLDWKNKVVFEETSACLDDGKSVRSANPLVNAWRKWQKNNYGGNWRDFWTYSANGTNITFATKVNTTKPSTWKNLVDLGEFKFQVDNVKYLQCIDGKWEEHEVGVVCQSNFVITEPYTVQKTPSWNLKASTETLSSFKQASGSNVPFSDYLKAIATSEYHPNQKVNDAMNAFIKKYEKLAVKVKDKKDRIMKKVPWKNIYFIDGNYVINGGDFTTPFTFVQTSPTSTITIKWSSNLNMMILTKWDIEFEWNCTSNQNVKWIFYAQWNLKRKWVSKNDDLNNSVWCDEWWLNIQWVLIWNGFNNLMNSSRSHLETWFDRDGSRSGDEQQLAKKIMNGWSVVIEYSPSIFTKSTMPPGAEDFTTALSIYRN